MKTPWLKMDNDGIKKAVQNICQTSHSLKEILQRIKDELAYPYSPFITLVVPKDKTGFEARALGTALGGVVTANGEGVQCLMHGHDEETIGF